VQQQQYHITTPLTFLSNMAANIEKTLARWDCGSAWTRTSSNSLPTSAQFVQITDAMAWHRHTLAEHGLGRGRGEGICGAEGGKARQAGAAARVVVQLAAEKLDEVFDLIAPQRRPAVPDQLLRQKLHACARIGQHM
jgi:hypothetical protein